MMNSDGWQRQLLARIGSEHHHGGTGEGQLILSLMKIRRRPWRCGLW